MKNPLLTWRIKTDVITAIGDTKQEYIYENGHRVVSPESSSSKARKFLNNDIFQTPFLMP